MGTRVTLKVGDSTIVREISAGRGHVGHQDDMSRVVIGVGKAETIDELTVRWLGPDGQTQSFKNVKTNGFYKLVEGDSLYRD